MQAARGTSVATAVAPRRRAWVLFAGVAGLLYVVDQVTKVLAVEHLSDRRDNVELVGSLLQLQLVRNPGAAFSTGSGYTPVLTVIAIVASLVVLWLSRRLVSLGWSVAFGFLLAGILGNLTDRILRDPGPFHGHVVDFLRLPNWPIFNVADISINVAAGLILVLAFRGIGLDGRRDSDEVDGGTDIETGSETDSETDSETGTKTGSGSDASSTAPVARDSGDTAS